MAARSSATLDLPGGPGTTGARKKGGLTAWFAQERVFRLIPFLLVEGTFLLLLAIPFVLTILMYYAILIPHTSQSLLGVRWSLFDTYLGLGMLYMATALPFVIWMMLSFIDEVPTTLEHAARLMGAGPSLYAAACGLASGGLRHGGDVPLYPHPQLERVFARPHPDPTPRLNPTSASQR